MLPRLSVFLFAICLSASAGVNVPARYSGTPIVQVFTEREVPGSPQTRCILAHPNGLIYVANVEGLTEYDGATWRMIGGTAGLIVHNVAADATGRVWYAATDEFGLLSPDATGTLVAQPLQAKLPEEDRKVGHVLRMLVHGETAFFVTQGAKGFVARADARGGVVELSLPAGERAVNVFLKDDAVHVIGTAAVYRVDGNRLVPEPSAQFLTKLGVQSIWPRDTESVWVVAADGLRVWRGGAAALVSDDVRAVLQGDRVTCGCPLANGTFALGTEKHGALIVEAASGRVLADYAGDAAFGAISSTIVAVAADTDGGLWLARFAGVTRVQAISPVALHHDVQGRVQAMAMDRGQLYVATTLGVFARERTTGKFAKLPDVPGDSWVLLPTEDGLIVGGLDLRLLRVDGTVEIIERERLLFRSALRLRRDPDRLVACTGPGLVRVYRRVAGHWRFEAELPNVRASLFPIVEDDAGWLWMTRNRLEVVRLDWREGVRLDAKLEPVGATLGLPDTTTRSRVWLFLLDGRVEVTNWQGLWRHDAATDRFVPETRIAGLDTARWSRAFPLSDGSLWLANTREQDVPAIARRNGPDQWQLEPMRYTGVEVIRPMEVCDDPAEKTVWLGYFGLASVDRAGPGLHTHAPEVHLRRIADGGQRVLWGGAGVPNLPALMARQNRLRIDYMATELQPDAFAATTAEYRTRLEGAERDWSPWSGAAYHDYANLPAGRFTFQVQARARGEVGPVTAFAFTVLPPWWRTWWFRAVASLVAVGAIVGLTRWLGLRALKRRVARLEAESAVERERLRLARDLHDEVGAGLGRVILFAGEAERAKGDPAQLSASLGRVRAAAQELVQHAREIVWAVSPQNDTVGSLVERLGDYAEQTLRAAGIACRFELDENPGEIPLSSEARHSLFLAVKEALHNCVKYAGAREVRLSAHVEKGTLTIVVADDGNGFAPGERRGSGHGLLNIVARAEALGGKADITSTVGEGTKVTIGVPIEK